MKRISWKNIYPWLGITNPNNRGLGTEGEWRRWGTTGGSVSMNARLWTMRRITSCDPLIHPQLNTDFLLPLVMWILSMSEQITGQHFSPRSQWRGSTCKNVLKYYELREACFLWRWVCVVWCLYSVWPIGNRLSKDRDTALRHWSGQTPETDHWVSDTAEITQVGHGRCHYGPDVIVVINLVSMTCCYRYNDHLSIGRYRPSQSVRWWSSPLIGQMAHRLASDWSPPAPGVGPDIRWWEYCRSCQLSR